MRLLLTIAYRMGLVLYGILRHPFSAIEINFNKGTVTRIEYWQDAQGRIANAALPAMDTMEALREENAKLQQALENIEAQCAPSRWLDPCVESILLKVKSVRNTATEALTPPTRQRTNR